MNEQKFPPRVGIERQHVCAITGKLRWAAVHGPRAHYIIDPVVNDEYLSLQEHLSIISDLEAKLKVAAQTIDNLLAFHDDECRFDHNGNCQQHAYTATSDWKSVTCLRCLAKKS